MGLGALGLLTGLESLSITAHYDWERSLGLFGLSSLERLTALELLQAGNLRGYLMVGGETLGENHPQKALCVGFYFFRNILVTDTDPNMRTMDFTLYVVFTAYLDHCRLGSKMRLCRVL